MGFNDVTLWLIMFAIFIIAELATSGSLISIWFCFGSLAAMATAKAGAGTMVQLVVFVVVSTALLVLLKPFIRKVLRWKIEPTNADAIIHKIGVVVERVDNLEETGVVKVDGKVWTARSMTDSVVFEVDTKVRIMEIKGVKVLVEAV